MRFKQKTGLHRSELSGLTVSALFRAFVCMLAEESSVLVSPGECLLARVHSSFLMQPTLLCVRVRIYTCTLLCK